MPLQYFGFQSDPFAASPDAQNLYPSHTHREALASLKYSILSNRGFSAMIAPPGMGKTTLLFRLLRDIRETSRSIFLFDIDPKCEPSELLGYILRDMGIKPGQSSSEMHEQFSNALARETRAGRKFVIIIDEAQNLSDAVLERVRLLTNFETSQGKLVQMVLSGQPQLSEKLLQPSLVQLRQRLSTICRLEPLSTEESIAYIDYRLKKAGYDGEELFSSDALKLITETSEGTPRTINNLCFNSLSLCRALNGTQVDASMVGEVISDLELSPNSRQPVLISNEGRNEQPRESITARRRGTRSSSRWAPITIVVTILCLLNLIVLAEFWLPKARWSAEYSSSTPKVIVAAVPPTTTAAVAQVNSEDPPPKPTPIEITVELDQTLRDISERYLGGYDLQRLHQLQKLNPNLTNPDHIVAGQKILLPVPLSAQVTQTATSPANERKLHEP